MNLTIRELIKILNGELILGNPKMVAKRAVIDSRNIKSGDLFFALKGERVDGHSYALSVSSSGAAGLVVSHMEWLNQRRQLSSSVILVDNVADALRKLGKSLRMCFNGPVIGITGSNGKTTTKQMLTSVMAPLGQGLSTKGNLNSQIGLPLMISELTTEDKWMVLEMGASEAGNISALAEIARPKIGVLTSIGPAHLKTFGSLQKIAAAKWELMDALPFDGVAVVPWGEPLLEPHVHSYLNRIVYFGEDPSCPVRASRIEVGLQVGFVLHLAGTSAEVKLPLGGRFNVNNALAAAAVGWILERPLAEIIQQLECFEPPKMRMEPMSHSSGAIFLNDAYNANPASMLHSVRSLVESFPDKEKVLMLGSMLELGEDADRMHFHLGTELAKLPLEGVFLYGDETEKILDGAIAAGGSKKKIERIHSPEEAVSRLKTFLKPNTIIMFKGSRGMKLEEIINAL